jgi:hypothetical protein
MFNAFKSSFDVNILAFLATFSPKIGQNFIQFSGHIAYSHMIDKESFTGMASHC